MSRLPTQPEQKTYRLPSETEATRICTAPARAQPGSEEHKALRNLLKSLEWAYVALSKDRQTVAERSYKAAGLASTIPAYLDDLLTKSKQPDQIKVLAVLRAILAANPAAAHTGSTKCRALRPGEEAIVGATLAHYKSHLDEINEGKRNDIIESIFTARWGFQKFKTACAKTTFNYGYEAVKFLLDQHEIKVDTTLKLLGAGGMSGPKSLELSQHFFDGLDEWGREATLVHESTHAIYQDPAHRTDDRLGYFTTPGFLSEATDVDEKLKNASHFQLVIERINRGPNYFPAAAAAGNVQDNAAMAEDIPNRPKGLDPGAQLSK